MTRMDQSLGRETGSQMVIYNEGECRISLTVEVKLKLQLILCYF